MGRNRGFAIACNIGCDGRTGKYRPASFFPSVFRACSSAAALAAHAWHRTPRCEADQCPCALSCIVYVRGHPHLHKSSSYARNPR